MIGHNFRLGEIESAIGYQQLKKLKKIVLFRQRLAKILNKGLNNLEGLTLPVVRSRSTHVYYVYPLLLSSKIAKHRSKIISLLKKEKVIGLMGGYTNLYNLPIFRKKIAYGKKNFKITEDLHNNKFFGILLCAYNFREDDMKFIVKKFIKVWKKIGLNVEK